MTVTVILCTYNRAHSLGTALESVLASTLPSDIDWESFGAGNNSNDHTGGVIDEIWSRPYGSGVVFESTFWWQ